MLRKQNIADGASLFFSAVRTLSINLEPRSAYTRLYKTFARKEGFRFKTKLCVLSSYPMLIVYVLKMRAHMYTQLGAEGAT